MYFDSAAVVRIHLRTDEVVTGALLSSFTPGGEELWIDDGQLARVIPLRDIHEIKIPYPGTSIGVDVGHRVGGLAAVAYADKRGDDDNAEALMLGMLAGAVVGGLIGSRITRWITVAERSAGGTLKWIPEAPEMIPFPPGGHHLATTCIRGESTIPEELVAVVGTSARPFYTEIRKAWRVDRLAHRLIPASTDRLRCLNATWNTRLPLAPPQDAEAALTFTPSPGKARLYVYHEESYQDAFAEIPTEFDVTIDSAVVGRTSAGTFLFVDLAPGTHRVGVAAHDKKSLSIMMAGDSSYFVQLLHKRSVRGYRFGSVERMKPANGREAIWGARLVQLN